MANRPQLQQAAALDEMLARVKAREGGQAPEPAGTTAAPSGAAVSPAPGADQGNIAGRIAKDIGRGAVESVPAVLGGVRNAYQNTINMGKELGGWLEDAGNLPVMKIDEHGVSVLSHEEAQQQRGSGQLHDLGDFVKLPDADILHPKSVTGGLIQGVAQFVTGFKGVGKLADAAGIPQAAGAAGYAMNAAKGAAANFASFDPHQGRLSDLVEKFPALSNPVTRFLMSKPDDNAADGRFKNALEGLGLGTLADGFMKAVKFLRGTGQAAGEAAAVEPQLATAAGPADIPQDAFRKLGDEHAEPGAPLVSREPVEEIPRNKYGFPAEPLEGKGPQLTPQQVAEGKGEEPTGVKINFARIDTPEDIQRTIKELAKQNKSDIEGATRGVQSNVETQLKAGQLDAWKLLESRQVGEAMNAEQTTAARQLWVAAADKMVQTARDAATSPNETNLFAFRKMLATYYGIQQHVIGARAEAGRALQAWSIPVGSMANRMDELNWRLLEAGGGQDAVRDMAQRVTSIAESDDPNAWTHLAAFAEKSAYAKGRDAVLQGWTDALLTSPVTQAKILASNATTALWRMGERAVAAKISSALGTVGGVQPGEVAAQWAGITGGWRDALAYAWKAAKTGQTGEGIGELHGPYTSNLSSEALGLTKEGWMGRGVDLLGTVLGLGRRGVAAQHDVALTLGYRMELNAQALRMATQEANAGKIDSDGINARVAEIIQNPPPNVNMEAVRSARYQAFLDEPGKIAQHLLELRNDLPWTRVILPFIKIPARIFNYAMERTPLAPLLSDWRANVTAGGARRDLALAQTGLGTAIMLTAADLTLSGRMKAQGPPETGLKQAEEREGARNWSVQVGNRWFDVNGIHPFGKLLTLAAAATEAIAGGQHELKNDDDTLNLATGTALAIAANVTNTSFTQGAADFFATLHDAKVRNENREGEQALLHLAGSVVPAASGAAARALDPYQRAVHGMIDEFKSRIPGLSSTLPPKRDLWGEPVKASSGPLEALFSPARSQPATHSPIDDEILRQGFNITLPPATVDFGHGARVDMRHYPEAYSRYLQLAGNEWKAPGFGMGAKDLLNAVVSGQHPMSQVYNTRSDGPEGGKEVFIRQILSNYREGARQQLLSEFPKLAAEVDDKRQNAQALRLPPR
jgi:hypothetical protein